MKILDDDKVTLLEYLLIKEKQCLLENIIEELGLLDIRDENSIEGDLLENSNYIVIRDSLVEDIESIFGNNYIKKEDDSQWLRITLDANKQSYKFCIFLAKNGAGEITVKEKKYTTDKLGELFEHVVHIALEESRKDYTVKRLVSIHKELKEICEECGIQFHSLERCNKKAQDGGVDLIAYRKTHDNAKRGHIILVQCSVGRNYVRKDKDCNLDHWNKYIGDLYTHTKMLAIPHIYLSRETHELGGQQLADAGEIFDRICLWQFINDDKLKEKYPDSYKLITTNEWL